jgi:hypothetical protein
VKDAKYDVRLRKSQKCKIEASIFIKKWKKGSKN